MKKKVLFLIHDFGHGGAEKVLVNLVNNMDHRQFDITVQTLFDTGVNRQFLSEDIRYIGGSKRMIKGNSHIMKLFSPQKLFKHYVKENYDVIVSYLEGPCARIVSGCTNPNTKLVCWIHGKLETHEAVSLGFRNYDEAKKCYERFDRVICVSQWIKSYFEKALDYQKTAQVLYNTIETEKIKELSNESVDDLSFTHDCVNICSTGKITTNKAFDRIARIHKRLLDENIKTKVYILGAGSEQANIEEYLRQNHLEDSYFFLGYKENPYKYVKECDLYVCSSYSEGFSTAVSEALIVGTPVVTTLCSGMTELLGENNEYGIVTENDEDALYEGIKSLLDDPELLAHYTKQAEIRGKIFSTEKTVKAVEDMLFHL